MSNDTSSLSQLLKDESFDLLIHLAAAKGDYNLKYDDFYRDNVTASEKTISLVKVWDIKSVIAYSTVSVYGHDNKIKSEEAGIAPNNQYGATKLESENQMAKTKEMDTQFQKQLEAVLHLLKEEKHQTLAQMEEM